MSKPQETKPTTEENCLENSIKISQLFNNLCTPILMACALGSLIFSGAHKIYFKYQPDIKIKTIKSDDSKNIKFLVSNSGGQPVVLSRAWFDPNFNPEDEKRKIFKYLNLSENDYILEPNKIHLLSGTSSELIPALIEDYKVNSQVAFGNHFESKTYCKLIIEYVGLDTKKNTAAEIFPCMNASILRQPN